MKPVRAGSEWSEAYKHWTLLPVSAPAAYWQCVTKSWQKHTDTHVIKDKIDHKLSGPAAWHGIQFEGWKWSKIHPSCKVADSSTMPRISQRISIRLNLPLGYLATNLLQVWRVYRYHWTCCSQQQRRPGTYSGPGAHSAVFYFGDREACPGVNRDMVRLVLRVMESEGLIESTGKERGTKWIKKG